MTAVDARPELEVSTAAGPLDDLAADAREVGLALKAMQARWQSRNGQVRIPAQALTLVEDLGTYGD